MSSTDGRPLVSTQDSGPESNKSGTGCLGCLSQIVGLIFIIYIISVGLRSCGKSDTDKPKDSGGQSSVQTETVMQQPDSTDAANDSSSFADAETLSDKAASVEKRYFHKFYTDMDTVEIHHFKERNELLENSVELLEKAAQGDFEFLDYQVKILSTSYYYITSDTTSEYYYVGKTKDNRPDGFGMIFGMSTGSGTYALADGFMIHYIGDFKNGAYDGFGALFSADEYDLSGMINNIVQSGEITSDEVLENAIEYLFNYVSYEGHFKDGKMNGKGNEFSFPNVEVGLPFDFNNDPIDGYRYYNIYPDVIMGEYKNNALTGMVKEYWHNHLWYSGEMDDGQESGKGAWYYNNGQVMYEGEFKKGKQSGKGSYYDENGNLIYSGEWENGDYAH